MKTRDQKKSASPTVDSDAPFALRDMAEVQRRRSMLELPHIRPLVAYTDMVRRARGASCDMPNFDPCDGGVDAKILFLLEAPGPRAVASSFVSRNNPDLSARNMNALLSDAGLPRSACLLWNIIPWYIGDGKRIRAAKRADLNDALPYLKGLLELLQGLRAIVLIGKPAASAAEAVGRLSAVPIHFAPHPSPRVFNIHPQKRQEALHVFKSVQRYL